MIFLLIEEDKVWFGRYLVGLAGSRTSFFSFFFLSFRVQILSNRHSELFSHLKLSWASRVSSWHRSSTTGEKIGIWSETKFSSWMEVEGLPPEGRWHQTQSNLVMERTCNIPLSILNQCFIGLQFLSAQKYYITFTCCQQILIYPNFKK